MCLLTLFCSSAALPRLSKFARLGLLPSLTLPAPPSGKSFRTARKVLFITAALCTVRDLHGSALVSLRSHPLASLCAPSASAALHSTPPHGTEITLTVRSFTALASLAA
jgi:hypothetical protein